MLYLVVDSFIYCCKVIVMGRCRRMVRFKAKLKTG